MSLDRCYYCEKIVDTDEFPEAYPWANAPLGLDCTTCVCENCQENMYDKQQEKLMEESP